MQLANYYSQHTLQGLGDSWYHGVEVSRHKQIMLRELRIDPHQTVIFIIDHVNNDDALLQILWHLYSAPLSCE